MAAPITAAVGKLKFASGGKGMFPPGWAVTFTPSIAIAANRVDRLGLSIQSFHAPLLQSVREVMRNSIAENFKAGGRPAWEPLSDSTLAIRESRWNNSSTDPLILTGRLQRVASQINIWTIDRSSASIRSLPEKVWYGAIQQSGYPGRGASKKEEKGAGTFAERMKKLNQQIDASKKTGYKANSIRPVSPIPARPFIMFQPEDEMRVQLVFAMWLNKRIRAAMW